MTVITVSETIAALLVSTFSWFRSQHNIFTTNRPWSASYQHEHDRSRQSQAPRSVRVKREKPPSTNHQA